MSRKPTQGWHCKTCKAEGEVPGTLRMQTDVLLNRIVAAHRAAAPDCQASVGGHVGYDQYGWYLTSAPFQTPHCEANSEQRASHIA